MVMGTPVLVLLGLTSLALACQEVNGQVGKLSNCYPQKLISKEATKRPRDCSHVQRCGATSSGVYKIYPEGGSGEGIRVFCDLNTAGGGWTVFQRRMDGAVNFFRGWHLYKTGFGSVFGEHWLGNDHLHLLTMQDRYELYILMETWDKKSAYARYKDFFLDGEESKFKLHISGYQGNAGDSLTKHHNNMPFSTKDRDNDAHATNCASVYKGAWWYGGCHASNLNGLYHHNGAHSSYADGVNWKAYKGYNYSMKRVQMMARPLRLK